MVQIVKCSHGKIFAACIAPECYTDSNWLKELKKYIKGGCTVEMTESKDWRFEKCECDKRKKSKEQLTLEL